MHEQWKKRKMFSNREQGIMSGLDPVPMVQGGYVPYPGMEMGGIVPPHTHPELHSHSTPSRGIDPGFIRERNPETGALTMLPKMQVGGVVPQAQLFEEGDNELNDALNSLASITKPDVPDMPMPMMEEKVEVKEEVTEDQGPSNFKAAVAKLKDTFVKEIENYIKQAGVENIGRYLKSMSVAYNNELNNLRKQFKVDKVDTEDQLFTEQFLSEFMADIPGMQSGGVVLTQEQLDELFGEGKFPLSEWNNYSPDIQKMLLRKAQIAKLEQDQATTGSQIDLSRLEELQAERRALAPQVGEAARANVATVGSPSGRYLAGLAAGRAAETAALDKAIGSEMDIAKAILNAQARAGTPVGGLDIDFTAKEAEAFSLEDIKNKADERERLQKQWDAAIEAEDGDFADALILFIGQTGGKLPVEYEGQIRFIPETGKKGDLLDYYNYLKRKKDPALSTTQLKNELEKWITFQVM